MSSAKLVNTISAWESTDALSDVRRHGESCCCFCCWCACTSQRVIWTVLHILCFPLAQLYYERLKKHRAECLSTFFTQYDHRLIKSARAKILRSALRFHVDSSNALGYIDLLHDEPDDSSIQVGQPRLPLVLLFSGDGSYWSPYYLDTSDVLVKSVARSSDVRSFVDEDWSSLVHAINCCVRNVSRDAIDASVGPVLELLDAHNQRSVQRGGLRVSLGMFWSNGIASSTSTTSFYAGDKDEERMGGETGKEDVRYETFRKHDLLDGLIDGQDEQDDGDEELWEEPDLSNSDIVDGNRSLNGRESLGGHNESTGGCNGSIGGDGGSATLDSHHAFRSYRSGSNGSRGNTSTRHRRSRSDGGEGSWGSIHNNSNNSPRAGNGSVGWPTTPPSGIVDGNFSVRTPPSRFLFNKGSVSMPPSFATVENGGGNITAAELEYTWNSERARADEYGDEDGNQSIEDNDYGESDDGRPPHANFRDFQVKISISFPGFDRRVKAI